MVRYHGPAIESTMYLIILIAGILGILNKKRLATLMALSVVGIFLYFNVHIIHALIPVAPHDTIDLLESAIRITCRRLTRSVS